MCYMYYNFAGAVKTPAQLRNAVKLGQVVKDLGIKNINDGWDKVMGQLML